MADRAGNVGGAMAEAERPSSETGAPDQGKGSTRGKRLRARAADAAKRFEGNPRLVTAARLARELLPGDSRFGDPLSTAGESGPQVVGRRVSQLTAERPGTVREMGLAAAQVWQALSEAQGRGRGHERVTIVFTDLHGFSAWALEAGDTLALDLLREVGVGLEQPIEARGGRVVKRLGDGLMAVFAEPADALEALFDARVRVREVDVEGYRPRLRAGVHQGRPRKLGGDYLGVDVNVAARLVERAGADEVVVSDAVLESVGSDELKVRRRRLKAKGAPKDLAAYVVEREG
jgi:adenylate cyclase